ncbi:MAG: flagellar export chaperone FliS [Halobacteriovoraceae bacterium]|jgi:flagellar secretion chaperone FliS|nr:flagellar export chaperone FliS [Halobacteriovoraceae bacterium]MBT5095110.1 flagellar export chaperone FliS [Halobacteriovoraceae bacterium]
MSYGLGAYKKTSIHTASKEQILLMLYQAAIRNCKKAIDAIESNQIAKKGEYIGKVQDIVIELNNSLDFEVGGEVATELSSLYDFVLFASTQANIKMEKEPLEGCLNVLKTLYDGWAEAIKSQRKEEVNNSAKA